MVLSWALTLALVFSAAIPAACAAARAREELSHDAQRSAAQIERLLALNHFRLADSTATAWVGRLEHRGDTLSQDYVEAVGVLSDARSALHPLPSPSARALAQRAVELQERLSGPASPRLVYPLARAAAQAKSAGDQSTMRALLARASALARTPGAPRDWSMARAYLFLGSGLVGGGQAAAADSMLARGLALADSVGVGDSLVYARGTSWYSSSVRTLGHFPESIPIGERAIAIEERLLGKDAPEVGRCLNTLGASYRRVGRMTEARAIGERSIRILESAAEIDSLALMRSISGTAAIMLESDPNLALAMHQRSLEITRRATPRDSIQISWGYASVALDYWNIGDFLSATDLLRTSLVYSPNGVGAPNVWGELAVALRAQGDSPAALDAIERAIALLKPLRYASQVNAWCWWARGTLQRDLADEAGAAASFEESAKTYRQMPSFRSMLWRSQTEWAQSQLALGNARAAVDTARAVVADMGPAWVGSDLHANALWALAAGEAAQGADSLAFAHAMQAERGVEDGIRSSGWFTSERAVLENSSRLSQFMDLPLVLAARSRDANVRRDAWDMLVRARALPLDVLADRTRELPGASDTTTVRLRAELQRARSDVAALTLRQLAGADSAALVRLRAARLERDRLDNMLILRGDAAGHPAADRSRSASLAAARTALADSGALVAFVRCTERTAVGAPAGQQRSGSRADAERMLAFVLPSRDAAPEIVDLGAGEALHGLVTRWREALAGDGGAAAGRHARALGDSLRRATWDRVAQRIARARRVFVVPDGALCEVNFAALPVGRDRFLVESGPTLHYLSTERDLLPRADVPVVTGGLLALGGVDFDARSEAAPLLAAQVAAERGAPARPAAVARAADCGVFREARFAALPGSLAEVEELAGAWNALRPGAGTSTLLTGLQASERAFRDAAHGRRVVHVATHGFFVDGDCVPRAGLTGSPLTAGGTLPYVVRENPLLLSGLVLAGANHHASVAPGADDGMLTAEEVASLDLAGTEWVVLSACETGLGVSHPGEGILGLRRAFAIAGAHTLITSLWKVPDVAAEDWMRELYRARFENRLDTAASMRAASLRLLRRLRERGVDPDPRLWGAFIATGDWR